MKLIIAMFPTILLAVYGQLITKWRIELLAESSKDGVGGVARLLVYLTDPFILSAYVAAIGGSVAWMFVIERYPISLAFPLYIGLTVLTVVLGGTILFDEQMTVSRTVAALLILTGVAIGSQS